MPAEETLNEIDQALTGMDRLDPAPQPPRAPRRPARRRGAVELGVHRDITRLPDAMRKGGIAAAALALAAELDTGELPPRESAGHAREIRQCLVTLAEMAPGDARGDQTDEVRQRRERRLAPDRG
jgi:hypothetical protein